MTEKILGQIECDPWPLDYILSSLQFLALDHEKKYEYLPSTFSETLFHFSDGDFSSADPLIVILAICADSIHAGKSWDDWIDDDSLKNKGFGALFLQLGDSLSACEEKKSFMEEDEQLKKKLLLCKYQATDILKKLDLYEENTLPSFSALELLDEYSYGGYSNSKK